MQFYSMMYLSTDIEHTRRRLLFILWHWAYLTKVVPETCRTYYIIYLIRCIFHRYIYTKISIYFWLKSVGYIGSKHLYYGFPIFPSWKIPDEGFPETSHEPQFPLISKFNLYYLQDNYMMYMYMIKGQGSQIRVGVHIMQTYICSPLLEPKVILLWTHIQYFKLSTLCVLRSVFSNIYLIPAFKWYPTKTLTSHWSKKQNDNAKIMYCLVGFWLKERKEQTISRFKEK